MKEDVFALSDSDPKEQILYWALIQQWAKMKDKISITLHLIENHTKTFSRSKSWFPWQHTHLCNVEQVTSVFFQEVLDNNLIKWHFLSTENVCFYYFFLSFFFFFW